MVNLDIAASGFASATRRRGHWIRPVVCISSEGRTGISLEPGLLVRGLPERMAGSSILGSDDLRYRERFRRGHGDCSPQRDSRRPVRIGDRWAAQRNSLGAAFRAGTGRAFEIPPEGEVRIAA